MTIWFMSSDWLDGSEFVEAFKNRELQEGLRLMIFLSYNKWNNYYKLSWYFVSLVQHLVWTSQCLTSRNVTCTLISAQLLFQCHFTKTQQIFGMAEINLGQAMFLLSHIKQLCLKYINVTLLVFSNWLSTNLKWG